VKRKFGFVLGACIIIGMVDLNTEQIVFATIYNPLNPVEEIIPKDQEFKDQPNNTKVVKIEETTIEPPGKSEENLNNRSLPNKSNKSNQFLNTEKQLIKRVKVKDIFLSNELTIDLPLPDNNLEGDGNDKPSYLASLCYLFTGNVLYGQISDGGLKTHVFDIFE
jgi:hypothetical protein